MTHKIIDGLSDAIEHAKSAMTHDAETVERVICLPLITQVDSGRAPSLQQLGEMVDLARELCSEIERLNKWADSFSDAQQKERKAAEAHIRELRAALSSQEVTGLLDPDMSNDQMRLHAGELTEQEIRTARAFIKLANAKALSAMSVKDAASLDERMKAAGMIPLSEMLKTHGPMEMFMQHAGVHTFAEFSEWAKMKQREYMTMRMRYELVDKDKSDDLFEWVFAHAAAFDTVVTQLRAISEGE